VVERLVRVAPGRAVVGVEEGVVGIDDLEERQRDARDQQDQGDEEE
jgi:hypothetical protein